MKLYEILIGLVIIGLIATGLTVFISSGTEVYDLNGYDNSSLETFNRMSELNTKVQTFNNGSGTVDSESNDDKLGSLFTSMYQSAGVLKDSVGILNSMVNDGIDNVTILGGFGQTLKIALGAIVTIALFIGIFMAFITKSERN